MHYQFPEINNISDMLPAISGADEFRVIEKGPYSVINYMVVGPETFPPVSNVYDALRRECRGIIFDTKTGAILRRPYHKFFNLSERPETAIPVMDFGLPHDIITKYDGSMIAPFYIGRELHFGTKLGQTEASEAANKFAHTKPNYMKFSQKLIETGYTPIFEWCSPRQRIVIRYAEDMLILTAIRDMRTGRYFDLDMMYQIAESYNIRTLKSTGQVQDALSFVKKVQGMVNAEGYVVRFHDGHMIKVKADEYLAIHRAKEGIVREKNVLQMLFEEKMDDILPKLPEEDAKKLSEYCDAVFLNVQNYKNRVWNDYLTLVNTPGIKTKKDFALVVMDKHKDCYQLMFKFWDGYDPWQVIQKYLLSHTNSSARVEEIRDIIGVTWDYGDIDA